MPGFAGDWSTSQLAEFLVAVGNAADEATAMALGVERAAEILEAEVAALVAGDTVLAAVGFPAGRLPIGDLVALGRGEHPVAGWLPGPYRDAAAALEDERDARLVVVRSGAEPCTPAELHLLRAMARGLAQTLRTLRTLENERAARAESERLAAERAEYLASLTERQLLLERLSRIQRSISHRMPLPQTLDAITAGAAELIGEPVVGLRLIDPDDPSYYQLASCTGVSPAMFERIRRGPVGEGAGGRAIAEDRLVIVEDYAHQPNVVRPLAEGGLTAAMAAPVHENGRVIGSLVIASYVPGRQYSRSEQEALIAFAEHASLALSDARNHAAMLDAQRAQEAFLATVSHELRTPLTVIMAALRTLQQHGPSLPPETTGELLDVAFARGRELEVLIEHLLRAARAELAGVRQHVDVPLLVNSTVSTSPFLHRLRLLPLPAGSIDVDIAAFRDTLGILVEHAAAAIPPDAEVLVDAALTATDLAVSVHRQGVGAPTTAPAAPFVPLARAPMRGTGAPTETGALRLYLVGRLAESMGGTVSSRGTGADLCLTLRVPRDGASAPERARSA